MSASDREDSKGNLVSQVTSTELFKGLGEDLIRELTADLERVVLPDGDVLFQEGDVSNAMYIVLSGRLRAVITQKDGSEMVLGEIGQGKPVGEMQLLTGGDRTASIHAIRDSELVKLPKSAFERAAAKAPELVQQLVELVQQRLRRNELAIMLSKLFGPMNEEILRFIDSQVEWFQLRRGEVLFRQGDAGGSLYILVSGRLKVFARDEEGNDKVIGEIARGESVGEMAIFTEEDRAATVYAVRECDLARFSKDALDRIIYHNPQVMKVITKIIIGRLKKTISSSAPEARQTNIALVPTGPGVPLSEFSNQLSTAVSAFGPTLHLSSQRLDRMIGRPGTSQTAKRDPYHIRLTIWLDEQESIHRYVLYETDMSDTNWTMRCIQRADRVIIVGQAKDNPEPGKIENMFLGQHVGVTDGEYIRVVKPGETGKFAIGSDKGDTTVRQTLVLLHPEGTSLPSGTGKWLEARNLDGHHHVRWGNRADCDRLARCLTGNSVGLVLGGGGARGFAHLGVIRALQTAGIPIDVIGGTSMGAIMGALPAMGWDYDSMVDMTRKSFVNNNPLSDYTLPTISIVRSKKLDSYLKAAFNDTCIEDLWMNYFCVSSNLTTADAVVSRRGLLWKAVRASASIPGIAVPVLQGNNLLVDGGILNNLPADIMRGLCRGYVIVVDVSSEKDMVFNYEKIPSPWKVLLTKLMPFKKSIDMPNLLEILGRTTLLSSINRANETRKEADLYLQPPVDRFKLMEWKSLDEIAEVGYEYCKKMVGAWIKENEGLPITAKTVASD